MEKRLLKNEQIVLQMQRNDAEITLIEAQNTQLKDYLQTVRCKLVASLNRIHYPLLDSVFREENFDNCLRMIHNLYASRGFNGESTILHATIKLAVADIQVCWYFLHTWWEFWVTDLRMAMS